MKIYFEDGPLIKGKEIDRLIGPHISIDAGQGYSACDYALTLIKSADPNATVYTNFTGALPGAYGHNNTEKRDAVFIREAGCCSFFHIADLLDIGHEIPQGIE